MNGLDLAISFDTTGSMYPCLTQVRRKVNETIKRLFKDIPDLRIAIIAHGDYCDEGSTYVTKTLDFSSNQQKICNFVENVGATGGGDAPECYELVLNEVRSLKWNADTTKAFIMIGDDVPHEPTYLLNRKKIYWKNELKLLLEAGIHIYGVHAMPGIRQHSKHFYQEIAKVTKGYYLTLDQFAHITDIIFAICYQQYSPKALQNFQQEVVKEKRMNRNLATVFQTLGGAKIIVVMPTDGLVPVPSGRFQVMDVDEDQSIAEFVEDQGLIFKKGKGFYEFTKPEIIQEKKEVILMDEDTGDMYSGAEARRMIGLPYGKRGRISPKLRDEYVVFVQSTSYNRKLIEGTRFLYEVEDV